MNSFIPPLDPADLPLGPVHQGGVYVFDVTAEEGAEEAKRNPLTAKQLLRMMISRREVLGSPVPEGYVPPPGIDLDELLKQLPPDPRAGQGG